MIAAAGMSKPSVHREELTEILALMADNQYSPVMDRTYPLPISSKHITMSRQAESAAVLWWFKHIELAERRHQIQSAAV